MKLDFGSGYNPYKNFKTCDRKYGCDFYNIKDVPSLSCSVIRCRNVIHHIRDLSNLFIEFKRCLSDNGLIAIIDVNKKYYKQNLFLDYLWYRWLIPRPEIWFANYYRNYFKMLNKS